MKQVFRIEIEYSVQMLEGQFLFFLFFWKQIQLEIALE